ncbi:MAG: type IV pilus assembly protein PilM [Candidatus Paceibacterota bacterium]|jgi:type IV pilus assembly protein PilM
MGLFSNDNTYLGIDIGGSTLKLVELEKKRGSIYLKNYASTYSNIKSDPLMESRENFLKLSPIELGRIMKEVFKATTFQSEKAAVSIPIHSTFTTILRLPADLEGEELNNAIKFEAKKHVPIPIEETILEWRVIRETQAGLTQSADILSGDKQGIMIQEVFLMAVPKDIVTRYQTLTKFLKVEPEVLEVEIFSLFRSAGLPDSGHYIFIDIGGQNTNVTVFFESFIKDTFNINISGDDFTRSILHEKRSLSFNDAEKLKREKGLDDPIVKSALLPHFEDIVDRIKRRQTDSLKVNKIILSGGAVLLKGLVEYFREKLGTEVEVINPWKNIIIPPTIKNTLEAQGPYFAVAVGLAKRGLEK